MGFEKPGAKLERESFSREEPLTDAEKKVYKAYIVNAENSPPKMEDFKDKYSEQEIDADKQEVKKLKEGHKEKTRRGEMLEAMLAEQIEESKWLGEGCLICRVTEYDDYKNHTDLVVEWKDGFRSTKLGIDVTTSVDKERLKKKLNWTKKEIDCKEQSKVKYLASRATFLRGAVDLHARVVVGLDPDRVKGLSEIIEMKLDNNEDSKYRLENYYVQIEILEEIESQLKDQIRYAKEKKITDKNLLIAKRKKVLSIIEPLLDKKKRSVQMPRRAQVNKIHSFLTTAAY